MPRPGERQRPTVVQPGGRDGPATPHGGPAADLGRLRPPPAPDPASRTVPPAVPAGPAFSVLGDTLRARVERLPGTVLDPAAGRDDAPGRGRPGRVPSVTERPAPGKLATARSLDDRQLTGLLREAVGSGRVRWLTAGGEAVLHRERTRGATTDGAVLVGLTLRTDQTGEQELTAAFAVGTTTRDAGLLATAYRTPDGHVALARAFGEAVVATAWQALLAVAVAVAGDAGTSTAGDRLEPALLRAAPGRLTVVPRAPTGGG
jgi:hypothetical protein